MMLLPIVDEGPGRRGEERGGEGRRGEGRGGEGRGGEGRRGEGRRGEGRGGRTIGNPPLYTLYYNCSQCWEYTRAYDNHNLCDNK